MTLVPPSTNNVYICQFPSYTDQVDGSCNCSYRRKVSRYTRFPLHNGSVQLADVQPGQLVSPAPGPQVHPLPWLLITARCGICFRRIVFPILTTVLSSPGDLYNCTEWDPDVWIPSRLRVGMCTVQWRCWFRHLAAVYELFTLLSLTSTKTYKVKDVVFCLFPRCRSCYKRWSSWGAEWRSWRERRASMRGN